MAGFDLSRDLGPVETKESWPTPAKWGRAPGPRTGSEKAAEPSTAC